MGNLSQDLIDQMHLIKPLLSAFMAPETSVKSSGLFNGHGGRPGIIIHRNQTGLACT